MTIGEKIRAFRKEAKLTQRALGEKCSMPDSQIRQYESGKVTPKIEQLQRIAAALDCAIIELISDDEEDTAAEKLMPDFIQKAYSSTSAIFLTEEEVYESKLREYLKKLNNEGLEKVMMYAGDLTKIPEYQK